MAREGIVETPTGYDISQGSREYLTSGGLRSAGRGRLEGGGA